LAQKSYPLERVYLGLLDWVSATAKTVVKPCVAVAVAT
jgi:hypothetical protein